MIMREEDCVAGWIQNCLDGKDKALIKSTFGHGKGFKFYSGAVPIAKFYPGTKQFVINPKVYCSITSKQQHYLREHLRWLNVYESEGLR